jgi:Xaa-Pro dipeptidase
MVTGRNIFDTNFDYQGRIDKIRKRMGNEVDCIIIHNWTNQYYLGGHYQHMPWYPVSHTHITESPLIIFRDHDPVFLCAFITMNAIREGTWVKDVRVIDQGFAKSAFDGIAKVLTEKGLENGNIGVEEKCMTMSTYLNLQKALPNARIKPAGDMIYLTRAVKTPDELPYIKKAVEICESAIQVARDVAKPGVTEMAVQLAMEIEMKRLGAFREVETMCQSGPRTANYRAFAADWKKIEEGELVTIDLGSLYKGYGCDIARTWVCGTPTAEQRKISKDLCATTEEFEKICKPGLEFGEVFDHIRGFMTKLGYQPNKTVFPCQQFTIHGVGLGPFHDYPHPTHRETIFEPGMVLSFQPAMRAKDYSIRFEDNYLVTQNGVELLSKYPRDLI